MDIIDNLVQIRKDKRIFQKSINQHLGINGTTLSRYESKKRRIPFDVVIKYADYLGYELRLLKK